MDGPRHIKTTSRRAVAPHARSANIGFRCAMSANDFTFDTDVFRGVLTQAPLWDAPYPPENATPQAVVPKTVVNGLREPGDMVFIAPWLVVSTPEGLMLVGSESGTLVPLDTLAPPDDVVALTTAANSIYVASSAHIWKVSAVSRSPSSVVRSMASSSGAAASGSVSHRARLTVSRRSTSFLANLAMRS